MAKSLPAVRQGNADACPSTILQNELRRSGEEETQLSAKQLPQGFDSPLRLILLRSAGSRPDVASGLGQNSYAGVRFPLAPQG